MVSIQYWSLAQSAPTVPLRGKLIDQREPCLDADGEVFCPIEVTLESGRGYLDDGCKLGEVFRDRAVTTIIPDNKMCASLWLLLSYEVRTLSS